MAKGYFPKPGVYKGLRPAREEHRQSDNESDEQSYSHILGELTAAFARLNEADNPINYHQEKSELCLVQRIADIIPAIVVNGRMTYLDIKVRNRDKALLIGRLERAAREFRQRHKYNLWTNIPAEEDMQDSQNSRNPYGGVMVC